MSASRNQHSEVVKILLGAKKYGWCALKSASQNGHDEIVKILLENGAQVDLQRKDIGRSSHGLPTF